MVGAADNATCPLEFPRCLTEGISVARGDGRPALAQSRRVAPRGSLHQGDVLAARADEPASRCHHQPHQHAQQRDQQRQRPPLEHPAVLVQRGGATGKAQARTKGCAHWGEPSPLPRHLGPCPHIEPYLMPGCGITLLRPDRRHRARSHRPRPDARRR